MDTHTSGFLGGGNPTPPPKGILALPSAYCGRRYRGQRREWLLSPDTQKRPLLPLRASGLLGGSHFLLRGPRACVSRGHCLPWEARSAAVPCGRSWMCHEQVSPGRQAGLWGCGRYVRIGSVTSEKSSSAWGGALAMESWGGRSSELEGARVPGELHGSAMSALVPACPVAGW